MASSTDGRDITKSTPATTQELPTNPTPLIAGGNLENDLQALSIAPKETKQTLPSPLLSLCPEILHSILDRAEPSDLVCLSLTCHQLDYFIRDKTKKTFKQLCPDQRRWLKAWSYIISGDSFHSHCWHSSIDLRPRQRRNGSIMFNDHYLIGRLEDWFGRGWAYCGKCSRYVPLCRCEACKAEGEEQWRMRVMTEPSLSRRG